eukprot:TRINITY_DN93006_c0_g1_i1.p1 TRINITY_DN93006_c0_g1~~TRINITY_DN93006_c0_g1_i1.p1  ORF type:complete len:513 (+),score=70.02 TRINITY_DN93006_c0_g1_i1:147-1685(+)
MAVFGDRVHEYQQNAAFVGFILVVCFAAFVYLTENLREVLIPLVWSAFFALPVTSLIGYINRVVAGASQQAAANFSAEPGDRCISLEAGPVADEILKRLEESGAVYVRIHKLRSGGARVVGPEVNRLVEEWSYYAVKSKLTDATNGSGGKVQLELFLDVNRQYPASLGGSVPSDSDVIAGQQALTGELEINKSSTATWAFAVVVAIVLMLIAVSFFLTFVSIGAEAVKENSHAYVKGFNEFINWGKNTFHHLLPESMWSKIDTHINEIAGASAAGIALKLVSNFENVGFQALLFMIYLLFWIFEPLPVNGAVGRLFKQYLFLKSMVCLLFAGMMSSLLAILGCPLWHLFFVANFVLNYVPEIGAMLAGILMLPAVMFNGNQSIEERQVNTVWLVVVGVLIKVFTGNVIEVQLYATHGGQHMRMHPVIMMALMMLCEALLGITGMFLAIPIMAAVKFYLVSTDMPGPFLNPLIIFIEGDEAGAHKCFVDRQRLELENGAFGYGSNGDLGDTRL